MRRTRPQILAFLQTLPTSDLPRGEYYNTLYKSSSNERYVGVAFSALKAINGAFDLTLITNISYNSSTVGDSFVGDNDVVTGSLTWFAA